MRSLTERIFRPIVELHRGEGPIALLLFTYAFLAMTAHNVLRPVTRSKFISGLGADNLPYVLFAAGLLIAVLMQAYTRALRPIPRRLVIPIAQSGLVVMIVAFWFLFKTGALWVPVAFYVFGMVLGILLISQFWTLANDILDARQAKRLFGFIGGGASLGGALGGAITVLAVDTVGTDGLLLVSAAVLALCVGLVSIIARGQHGTGGADPVPDEARGVGGREAVRLFLDSPQVRTIALVIGCAAVGAAIVEQQLNMAAESIAGAGSTDVITAFLGQVTFYLSVAGFVVQVGLTSRIHRSLGLAFALLLLPVGLGSTALVILVTGAIWAPAVARVLDATLRYTIDKTSREVLFLPLPAGLRYRAKPFIDVTADRLAKASGALLLLVLIKPWGFGLDWMRLSYASLAVMAVWVLVALSARREYLKAFRARIGARALAPEYLRVDAADAATIETLVEELSSPDEESVLYAIQMLEALDKRNLVTPLLLHHESPKVRTRALMAIGFSRTAGSARWTAMVGRMLTDEDVGVRAAAMRALSVLRPDRAVSLMREYLADPEPRIAVTAAVGLASSGSATDSDLAFETLQRLVADTRPVAASGRLEAARALAHIPVARFRTLVVPLLHDDEFDVASEAIRSARRLGAADGLFVPALLSLLGHRALKRNARQALMSYGDEIIEVLGYVLRDREEHVWVRRHVPATLALIPGPRSTELLVEALQDPDGFVRFKALEALERLHTSRTASAPGRPPAPVEQAPPSLSPSHAAALEALLHAETSRYYTCFTLRHNLLQHGNGAGSLLVRALDEKLARCHDRVYRILGLLYPGRGVPDARYAIEHGEPRRRAAAVEYIDALLAGRLRKRVVPILEPMPPEVKILVVHAVFKSRPRDIDDTIAQLVHEDDPVVSASAIRFAADQRLTSLADDLRYLMSHRYPGDRPAFEAAVRTLRAWDAGSFPAGPEPGLPIVELADRLRATALGRNVPVDELFLLAEAGRQRSLSAAEVICREGDRVEKAWFFLDGSIDLTGSAGRTVRRDAPAVIGLDEVLQGTPGSQTVTVLECAVCLEIGAGELLSILSNSTALAQGLFRMVLMPASRHWQTVHVPPPPERREGPPHELRLLPPHETRSLPPDEAHMARRTLPMQPIHKAIRLRQHPLFSRATSSQLFELASITREIELVAGAELVSEDAPAAIYNIVQGEVRLESDEAGGAVAAAGTTIGVAETLAGMRARGRVVVTRDGSALQIDAGDLFGVLADRIDLLQGVFGGVLEMARSWRAPAEAAPAGELTAP
jgi:ATP:ADP antiporter, AAA family